MKSPGWRSSSIAILEGFTEIAVECRADELAGSPEENVFEGRRGVNGKDLCQFDVFLSSVMAHSFESSVLDLAAPL